MVQNYNPKFNTFVAPPGYKSLGWQLDRDQREIAICIDKGHKIGQERRLFNNSRRLDRTDDMIEICDVCQYYHHSDSTD